MLGRRVTGARKVVVAVELPSGGAVVDPAVDIDRSNLAAYRESLWDAKHLNFLDGERPTWFHVQPLTRRQKDACETFAPRATAAWYLRCALLAIDNYQIVAADGSIIDAAQPERVANGAYGLMASEKYIDDLNLPEPHLLAIWLMIRTLSEAQLPLSKPSSTRPGVASGGDAASTEPR